MHSIKNFLLEKKHEHSTYSDGTLRLSRSELIERIFVQADVWSKLEVDSSSIILIPSGRGLNYFIELLAAWYLGATTVPLDPHLSAEKKSHLLRILNGPLTYLDSSFNEPVIWKNESFKSADVILFTSGSTGTPKGVIHSLSNLLGNASATLESINLLRSDYLYFNIPYHFTSAICHFLAAFISGASLAAIEDKLYSAELHQSIDEFSPNCFGGSPIQLLWLANSSMKLSANIKWFMSSGDDLPVSTIQSLREKYVGADIVVAYGLTEIGGRGCILRPEYLDNHLGSVGKCIEGLNVSVRDENFEIVPINVPGNIFFSGRYLLSGFVGNTHKTEISSFGFSTGDVGYLDENGFLFLLGRSDDVFKVAGKKVSSIAIRRVIIESGFVEDAAVIPVNDNLFGQIPCALVVPKSNQLLEKGALLRFMRDRLPSDYIPKIIQQVQEIPRTNSGKIIKGKLRELFSQ